MLKRDSRDLAELQTYSVVVTVNVSKDFYKEVELSDGDTDFQLDDDDESTSNSYEYKAEDYDLSHFGFRDYLEDIVKCFTSEGATFSYVASDYMTAHWAEAEPYTHPYSGQVERVSVRFDMTFNDTAPMCVRYGAQRITDKLTRAIRETVK